jgi:hypothetical protein
MTSPDARPERIIRQKVTPERHRRTQVRSYFDNGQVTVRIDKISRTGRIIQGEEESIEPRPEGLGIEPKNRNPQQDKNNVLSTLTLSVRLKN